MTTTPKPQLALVANNNAPAAGSAATAGLIPVLASVPTPQPPKPPAPLPGSTLSFIEQIAALTGETVTPAEMANAVFRVNLTPRNAHIDTRPDHQLSPNEKLTINSLANKFSKRTAPATLEEATQLAIWRGTAQALRF